ncbi:MAG TPA: DUF3467 domain-containing protein [Chthoniobacteraceae bacterium]|jgi:hypothetical protein
MSNLPNQPQQQVSVQVRHETMSATYANQVLITTNPEECFLEFSPGVSVDRATGAAILPIHTRVAMTPAGLMRLHQAIGKALQNYQVVQNQSPVVPDNLPPLDIRDIPILAGGKNPD